MIVILNDEAVRKLGSTGKEIKGFVDRKFSTWFKFWRLQAATIFKMLLITRVLNVFKNRSRWGNTLRSCRKYADDANNDDCVAVVRVLFHYQNLLWGARMSVEV